MARDVLEETLMRAQDELSLRRLFRRMVWVVAATSGCGASVTVSPGDASVDVPPAVDVPILVDTRVDTGVPRDVPIAVDVPPAVDVPLVRDVPIVADRGSCDPIRRVINPGSFCASETVVFPCGLPTALQIDSGDTFTDPSICRPFCTIGNPTVGNTWCNLFTTPDGSRGLQCQIPCPGGRRPEGFVDRPVASREELGGWFARLAALESASVDAFDRMVDELTLHRAPDDLLDRARAAVVDERRHTALTVDLARAYGHEPSLAPHRRDPSRPLDAVALDNAVEGCVRETYGALVATWQAGHALDPRVAAAMEVIAEDETRHAALSWALHAWACERLDEGARASLTDAMRRAVEALRHEASAEVGDDLVSAAGMPTRAQQSSLLDALVGSMPGLA